MSVARAIQSLRRRGLVADVSTTGQEVDAALLQFASASSSAPLSVYAGFDPTGKSLHLGHLAVLLALRRFQGAGLRPILLVSDR